VSVAENVARFVRDATLDRLPPAATARAKEALVDTLGCALAGGEAPASRVALALLDGAPPSGATTVLTTGGKASVAQAVFANAVMASALDFDAHPAVVEAVASQGANGFHAGGESPLAVEWGELVQSMVPSAERVRFVASGGEAMQMAIRVARAHAGRDRILKFQATYHGWHDAVCLGVLPPDDVPFSLGVPKAIQETVTTLPFNDLDAVAQALDRYDDVAGVILEPGGCFDDSIPTDPAFLRGLRELTARKRVLLVFDEVVTGFRYARGGAQEYFGVTPDLTALGKVVAGGCRAAPAGRASSTSPPTACR
jgi:acetylornithine/succinyldiaminopimelate/putrescine aminotransferase